MLTSVRLANFKAFGRSQRVPLRPITLLFGANSAGKSSVIHSLALAHHAIHGGDLDTQRTQIGGEAIDLGGFRQYVHRRQRERRVELAFELNPGDLSGRTAQLLRSARTVTVEVAIGSGLTGRPEPSRAESQDGAVRVERFGVDVDGAPLLSMSARAGGQLRLDRLDHAHSVFRDVFRAIVTLATTTPEVTSDDFAGLGKALDELVPAISARTVGLFPRIEELEPVEGQATEPFIAVSRGRRQEDLARASRLFVPGALRDLVEGLASAVNDEIRKLRYLGPLRSNPPRHLAFAQHHDPNWFSGGGYAWDVVRAREDARQWVNEWLGNPDRLKTPYELVVRDLLPAAAIAAELPQKLTQTVQGVLVSVLDRLGGDEQPELVALATDLAQRVEAARQQAPIEKNASLALEDLVATGRAPEVQDLASVVGELEVVAERWAHDLVEARGESIRDLMLIDKRTGTIVSHRDVGIGVSQVLPVLVSAYASRDLFLAIEQPEIHLHPALQAELGDVFLASALGHRNVFLLETHSENLILRILRRIRETTDGDLEPGATAVRPDDVSVLFVQSGQEGAEIVHIPVTEDGEFARPWPEGFFPERARELF
jgi:AAA domain, putative AbiEii toxin, Type IV TA system/Protein of unknown function (DUF3696)